MRAAPDFTYHRVGPLLKCGIGDRPPCIDPWKPIMDLVRIKHGHDVRHRIPQGAALKLTKHIGVAAARLSIDYPRAHQLVSVNSHARRDTGNEENVGTELCDGTDRFVLPQNEATHAFSTVLGGGNTSRS